MKNNTLQKKQLESLCSSVIKAFWGKDTIPERVDIEAFITHYLHYDILYKPFANKNVLGYTSDGSTYVDFLEDGMTVKICFPKNVIVVDEYFKNKNSFRRREILAHEAGHILFGLVEGKPISGFYSDRSDGYSEMSIAQIQQTMKYTEACADCYGLGLLMPDYVIKNLIDKYHDGLKFEVYDKYQFLPAERRIFDDMAHKLGVTKTSLFIRLRSLDGFIESNSKYIDKLFGGVKHE